MSPVALQLLRRIAAGALVLAALLGVAPRLLSELGVLGPTVDETVEQARRAVEAARSYGARAEEPSLKAALGDLDRARDLARRGQGRQARHAATAAAGHAVAAQRVALVQREQTRRDADRVVKELDRRLDELEKLYGEVTVGLDKPTASSALSLMKGARQTGARLFVAFEEGDFDRVLAEHEATQAALAAVRDSLQSIHGARPTPTPSGRSAQR